MKSNPNLDRLASDFTALGYGIVPVNGDTVHFKALDGREHLCILSYNPKYEAIMGVIDEGKIVFVKAGREVFPQMETKKA